MDIEEKKVTDKMIDYIMTHSQVKTLRKECCPTCKVKGCSYSGIHRDCIKEYFERRAEREEISDWVEAEDDMRKQIIEKDKKIKELEKELSTYQKERMKFINDEAEQRKEKCKLRQEKQALIDKLEYDDIKITENLQDGKHNDYQKARLRGMRAKLREILKLLKGENK